MLIGLVLGLAIYNGVLLDFPLPIALYRKLLGQQPGLRDLCEMDPTLGKSLTQLLEFEGQHNERSSSRCYLSNFCGYNIHEGPAKRALFCNLWRLACKLQC